MNYLYQRYGCYMENVDLTTVGPPWPPYEKKDSPEECEKYALNTPGANGFVWTKSEGMCYTKTGDVEPKPDKTPSTWAGLLPCP